MKKIAFFTERLKSGFGVDNVVNEQANLLSGKHEVVVFTTNIDNDFVKKAKYPIYKLDIPLSFNPIKQDLISYRKFKNYSHFFKLFDTFVIHTPTFNSWSPLLSKLGKLITYYYGNSPSYGYKFPNNLRKDIYDISEKKFYFNFSEHIFTISNFLKDQLPKKVQNKTIVNYLGKEHVTRIKKSITNNDLLKFKKKYFIEDDEKIFIYVGRLDYKNNPYKNTGQLIKINRFFKKIYKNKFRLIAIGVPENNIEIEFFNNRISLISNASNKQLVCAYLLSHVYLTPSLWEGFNLPILEAQALGLPVVAYNVGAHSEVVNNRKSGFLVDDFSEFLKKLLLLSNNNQLRNKLSYEAKINSNNFSWNKNVRLIEKYL